VLMAPVAEPLSPTVLPPVMVPTPQPSAAATGVVESVLAPITGNGPVAPVESAVSWVMLAAARRELGTPAAAQTAPAAAVPTGPLSGTDAVSNRTAERSAIPASAAAEGAVQIIDPVASATATNPIAAFFEQIGAFVSQIVTAITQVINQVVSAITNFFVPGTSATIIDTIALNEPDWTPGSLVVSPDSKRLYMPLTQYGGVAVINIDPTSPAVNTVTSTIGAGNGIWSFADAAITPDGTKLFLVSRNEDSVLTLDAAPGNAQPAYTSINLNYSPRALAISADGTRAYVTYSNNGSKVSVIDTATLAVIATVPLVGDPNPDYVVPAGYQIEWYQPDAIALSPNGTRAYVIADQGGFPSKVLVIDTVTLGIVDSVRVGTDPLNLVASPDGKRVYVANLNSNSVSVIDTATNTVASTIGTRVPEHLAISPDGKKLFVSNWIATDSNYATTSTVSVIDTATKLTTATIPVNGAVADMVVSLDGTRLYITATGPIGATATPTRILVVSI